MLKWLFLHIFLLNFQKGSVLLKLVFLDAKTIGDDISLAGFSALGEFVTYDYSTPEEAAVRTADADIVLTNKVPINAQTIGNAENLKFVCETATGTNNLDKNYLHARGIDWRNAAGYSTDAVAQHTFAMLFYLLEKLPYYDEYVKSGRYSASGSFTHFAEVFQEIAGKTWGIIGLGAIGRKVAHIAAAFGANVIYYSASGRPGQPGYQQVDWETLLAKSDILSVHAPLTPHTENLLNREAFSKMKDSCILLNLARGPIVNEQDLADALTAGEIAAAGLDVLCGEPPEADNPLFAIKDSRRLLITPHMAWATQESRQRLMDICLENIKEWLAHRI